MRKMVCITMLATFGANVALADDLDDAAAICLKHRRTVGGVVVEPGYFDPPWSDHCDMVMTQQARQRTEGAAEKQAEDARIAQDRGSDDFLALKRLRRAK